MNIEQMPEQRGRMELVFRNEVQAAVLKSIGLPEAEIPDWLINNGARISDIIDEDPQIAELANTHDIPAARDLIIEKLGLSVSKGRENKLAA